MPKKKDELDPFSLLKTLSDDLRSRADTVGISRYVPMEVQKKFHETETQGRLYSGGNRAGKTVAGVVEDVKWLTGTHEVHSKKYPPPVRGRACAVDFDRGVELVLIPEFKKWIPPQFLIDGKWEKSYHKSTRILALTNGSTCEFMSYDQDVDKFAGTSRHFVHFDEEPPKSIFTECLARLIDTNGMWWMTMTPLIEFSWTEETLFEPIRDGLVDFISLFEASTDDNVHIEDGAIEKLTFIMDEDERQARTKGSGYAETTRIFPEFKNAIIDPIPVGNLVEAGYKFFTAKDHGLRNPTAILWFAYNDEEIIVFDEYYERDRLVHENALAYKRICDTMDGVVIEYMVGDPSTQNRNAQTGTSIQHEYGENGVWYFLGNNNVKAGLLRIKSALSTDRLKVTANCVNLIREARTYKWKKPISSKVQARSNLMEEPVKRNDHALDALRYGLMTLPQTEKEEEIAVLERLRETMPVGFVVPSNPSVSFDLQQEEATRVFDEHLGYIE